MRSLVFLAALLGAVAIAPIGAATPPDSFAVDGLRVTPPILNFGAVAQGETRERTFSVTNTGSEPVLFTRMGVPDGLPLLRMDFSTFGSETCPLTGAAVPVFLQPGDTCEVTVFAEPISSTLPGTYGGAAVLGEHSPTVDKVIVPLTVIVR
jgi:hypothetical protein